jgi:hypothetical protein
MAGPFFPGSTPGSPLMMFQPRTAQATAFQQASELVAETIGEPSLRIDPADADPAGTFVQRVRQLPPAKRKAVNAALAAACIELLRTANLVLGSGMIASASQLVALALAFYAVYLALEE